MGLGANLGDPPATLAKAVERLGALGTVVARSSLYRTTPVGGPAGQPDYLNAVVGLAPAPGADDPVRLLRGLHAIEADLGRRRRVRWEARVVDLDLLAYGERVLDAPELVLPHPHMMDRAFVLVPLVEVAPAWRDPRTGRSASEALEGLDTRGVCRSEADWNAR